MPTTYPPLPPHSSSRDGSLEVEFSGGQWLHQSCLFSEISIKNKKQQQQKENRVSENFQVVKQLEELWDDVRGKDMKASYSFSYTLLHAFLFLSCMC